MSFSCNKRHWKIAGDVYVPNIRYVGLLLAVWADFTNISVILSDKLKNVTYTEEVLIVLLQEIVTPWVSCLYLSFATAEWNGTKLDGKQGRNDFY